MVENLELHDGQEGIKAFLEKRKPTWTNTTDCHQLVISFAPEISTEVASAATSTQRTQRWKSTAQLLSLKGPRFSQVVVQRLETIGTSRSDDGDGNGNATKAIGLISKTTIIKTTITTTTSKCLISRCTEEVHKRRRNFLSLSQLGYGSQEFNVRMVRLHLTKLVTWINRNEY